MSRRGLAALPLAGLVLVYAKILLTEAFLAPIDSDEGMYSGAAWCVASGRHLYQDVVFTQTPGAAWLYAALIKTTGYSLLGMRLLNGCFALAVPLLAAILVWGHGPGAPPLRRRSALVAFTLVAFSDQFLIYNGIARNYAPALAFALAAFLALLEAGRGAAAARRLAWLAAAGLALAAAVQFKHSMLVLLLPYCLLAGARSGRRAGIAWFVGAFLLCLAPTLMVALRAPDAFVFGAYSIHQLIADWRLETGHHGAGLANKLRIWRDALLRHGWIITAPSLVAAIVLSRLRLEARRDAAIAASPPPPGRALPVHALGISALLAAFYFWLTPTWPDYATQVTPFLAIGAVTGLSRILTPRPATIVLTALAVLAVALNPRSLDRLVTRRLDHPSQLARFHDCAAWLRGHVSASDPVLSVFPPYLLAAGRDPTAELAGGITAMNIADRLDPRRRREWKVMSKQEMMSRVQSDAYDWVVTGTTSPRMLNEWLAQAPNWRLAAYWSGGLAVYARARPADSSATSP